jgi:hypothetical protein
MGRPVRLDTQHLRDAELFSLALPPTGQPEALPEHLSDCLACSRALAEWKNAVRELAVDDAAPIASRSPAQWTAAEDRTLEAIRRLRPPRPRPLLRWALGAAAALLVGAIVVVAARRPENATAARKAASSPEWSAQDQADDALLRDVASLSRGENAGAWTTLAPDPKTPAPEEEKL